MFIVHNKILSQYFSINLFQLLYSLPKFRLNAADVGFSLGRLALLKISYCLIGFQTANRAEGRMDITPFNEKNTENFKFFSEVPEVFLSL